MRNLSTAALQSAHASETGEVWLLLLTIDHPDLPDPLRFARNTQSVTSRGNLFIAFPFDFEFPGQEPDSPGEARVVVDNIDRQIVETIRILQSPPDVTVEVVLASQPDQVEAVFEGLTLRNTQNDVYTVSGTLRYEDIVTEPVSVQMTPSRFPGMFALLLSLGSCILSAGMGGWLA